MDYVINFDDLPMDIIRLFNLHREPRFRNGREAYFVYTGHVAHKFTLLQLIRRLDSFFGNNDAALAISVDGETNAMVFYPHET